MVKRTEEQMDTLIKPSIQALIDRGNVTWQEYTQLAMNFYERMRLLPALTDDALIRVSLQYFEHASPIREYPVCYNEVISHVLAPLLTERLQAKTADAVPEVNQAGGWQPYTDYSVLAIPVRAVDKYRAKELVELADYVVECAGGEVRGRKARHGQVDGAAAHILAILQPGIVPRVPDSVDANRLQLDADVDLYVRAHDGQDAATVAIINSRRRSFEQRFFTTLHGDIASIAASPGGESVTLHATGDGSRDATVSQDELKQWLSEVSDDVIADWARLHRDHDMLQARINQNIDAFRRDYRSDVSHITAIESLSDTHDGMFPLTVVIRAKLFDDTATTASVYYVYLLDWAVKMGAE